MDGRVRDGEGPGCDQGHDGQRHWVDPRPAAELDLSSINEFRHRRPWGHGHGVVALGVCGDDQENTPSIMYGGHYDDIVVREDGHWKFRSSDDGVQRHTLDRRTRRRGSRAEFDLCEHVEQRIRRGTGLGDAQQRIGLLKL